MLLLRKVMKHPFKTILGILLLFVLINLFSVGIVLKQTEIRNNTITCNESMVDRPQEKGLNLLLFIIISMIVLTLIMLLMIRKRLNTPWKLLMGLSFIISIGITLSVFMKDVFALIIAVIITVITLKKPNPLMLNIAYFFSIPGIVLLFAPLLSPIWALLLLVIVSIYDYIAVNITKHMVTIAKGMGKELFTGIAIPYKKNEWNKKVVLGKGKKGRIAFLGGGDLAFPSIMSSSMAIFLYGITQSKIIAFLLTLPLIIGATIALMILFLKSEKGRFYPAMPAITIGCLVGIIIDIIILRLLIYSATFI